MESDWQVSSLSMATSAAHSTSPNLNGNFSVGTLTVNGNELGALSASIAMNDAEIRIPDGSLAERDGGGVRFSLVKPREW